MLSESIHTDITICASNETIEAHRAVLAARSPVFHSMFSHDLKEKKKSAINISDMIIEACQAFLSYIYTNIEHQDFIKHRLYLLRVADKYDVLDLKDFGKIYDIREEFRAFIQSGDRDLIGDVVNEILSVWKGMPFHLCLLSKEASFQNFLLSMVKKLNVASAILLAGCVVGLSLASSYG
ncbi:BTB/POZ domain-containing protein-like protein [Tanacetum coccineum]